MNVTFYRKIAIWTSTKSWLRSALWSHPAKFQTQSFVHEKRYAVEFN